MCVFIEQYQIYGTIYLDISDNFVYPFCMLTVALAAFLVDGFKWWAIKRKKYLYTLPNFMAICWHQQQ